MFNNEQINIPNFMQNMGWDKLMQSYNKNMQALSTANRLAMEVWQGIGKLQNQYFKQAIHEGAALAQKSMAMQNGSQKPQDAFNGQADSMKGNFERVMEYSRQMTDMVQNSSSEIMKVMSNRFNEAVEEGRQMIYQMGEACSNAATASCGSHSRDKSSSDHKNCH